MRQTAPRATKVSRLILKYKIIFLCRNREAMFFSIIVNFTDVFQQNKKYSINTDLTDHCYIQSTSTLGPSVEICKLLVCVLKHISLRK